MALEKQGCLALAKGDVTAIQVLSSAIAERRVVLTPQLAEALASSSMEAARHLIVEELSSCGTNLEVYRAVAKFDSATANRALGITLGNSKLNVHDRLRLIERLGEAGSNTDIEILCRILKGEITLDDDSFLLSYTYAAQALVRLDTAESRNALASILRDESVSPVGRKAVAAAFRFAPPDLILELLFRPNDIVWDVVKARFKSTADADACERLCAQLQQQAYGHPHLGDVLKIISSRGDERCIATLVSYVRKGNEFAADYLKELLMRLAEVLYRASKDDLVAISQLTDFPYTARETIFLWRDDYGSTVETTETYDCSCLRERGIAALETRRAIEDRNLQRWLASGYPSRWVGAHPNGWDHQQWLSLLGELGASDYWPLDAASVGSHLESLKSQRSAG